MKKVISLACTLAVLGALHVPTAFAAPAPTQAQGQPKVLSQPMLPAGVPSDRVEMKVDDSKTKEALIKEVQQITDAARTQVSLEDIQRSDKRGQEYYDKRLYAQALTEWQKAYGDSLELKYAEGQGKALTNMAKIYVDQGQWIKAKQLGENAIEVLSGGGSARAMVQARIVLSQAYFGLDNPVWASQQLDAALKLISSGNISDPEEGARVMYLCGNLCLKFNKPTEAIKYFQEGAQYSSQRGDIDKTVQVRSAIVSSMIGLGWYVAALEEANKLISIAKSAPKFSNVYQVAGYQALANAQFAANEFANARKSYEQVYALLAKVDPKSVGEEAKANIDEGYGFVLGACGDYDLCRQNLLKAIAVFKAKSDNFSLAQCYNALGTAEVLDGQPGKGLSYFQQAVDFHTVVTPKAPRLHAVTLLNQAIAEFRTGSYRDARNHVAGAYTALPKEGDQLLKGRLLQSQAEVCLKAADLTAAESFVNKALKISEPIKDDSALWRSYVVLGKIQLSRQEVELAKESFKSALSYFRSPQSADFPSTDSLGFPTSREDMSYMLVQALASQGMTEQALVTAEQIKEENFIIEWTRRGGQVKPEDRDTYVDLSTERARLHAAELGSTPQKIQSSWQSWMERMRSVQQSNRALARLISPVPTMFADIVASATKLNAVMVDYLVGPDTSIVFTIEPSGRLSSTTLQVGRSKLKSQVAALLASAAGQAAAVVDGNGVDQERAVLRSLYGELLPPGVRQFLPHNSEQMIVFVPDGPLYNLPFAALIDEQGKFLVEGHLLTMASSMSVLLDSQPKVSQDFSLISASSSSQASEKAEMEQIASVIGSDRITSLYGKDAAIDNLEEQARGKAVVHFASRLPLLESNPLRSVLPILGTAPEDGTAAKKVTAEKLFGAKMPSDLMVWSGSSVNAKDVRGNAVKVFSRGLNYAGARNVLMSLWTQPESDKINELVNFYKSKQSGLGTAQSLRKAQLTALSKDRSPRTWAGFQLLGPGI